MQQGGFAGAGRTHEGDEVTSLNVDVDLVQRIYLELVAKVFLAEFARFDHYFGHCLSLHCRLAPSYFAATFWPSLRSGGGFKIRSSPPIKPLFTTTPCAVVPPVATLRL